MKQYLKEKWQFIVLSIRNLLNLPSEDGKRRLVKNPITKVWEWTEGDAPLITTFEELQPTPSEGPHAELENVSGHTLPSFLSNTASKPFEPKVGSRFIVNFPSVEPFFINRYLYNGKLSSRKMANGKVKIREHSSIDMYLPIGSDNDIDALKNAKIKNLGNASIEILDVTGVAVRTISLKNVKIEDVNIYSDLDYDNDNPLLACITFSHDQREFK
jgi:hypothetical protein